MVRAIKEAKKNGEATKEQVDAEVAKLLELKKLAADLENPTQEATPDAKKQGEAQREGGGAKPTQDVGVTPKSEDFARWYLDVIRECELAVTASARHDGDPPVRVCAVGGHSELDGQTVRGDGRGERVLPQLIPYSFITKEASHVEGFAPSSQSSRKAVAKSWRSRSSCAPRRRRS